MEIPVKLRTLYFLSDSMASFGLHGGYDPSKDLGETPHSSIAKAAKFPTQNFDYFLVLDFEANKDHKTIKPMEIIEFPVLKVSGKTFETEAVFHHYIIYVCFSNNPKQR